MLSLVGLNQVLNLLSSGFGGLGLLGGGLRGGFGRVDLGAGGGLRGGLGWRGRQELPPIGDVTTQDAVADVCLRNRPAQLRAQRLRQLALTPVVMVLDQLAEGPGDDVDHGGLGRTSQRRVGAGLGAVSLMCVGTSLGWGGR